MINLNLSEYLTTRPVVENCSDESEELITYSYKNNENIVFHSVFYSKQGETRQGTIIQSILNSEKEDLYIRAIRNLYKKMDYSSLLQALENQEISEDEFDVELENNEEKYLIPYPQETPSPSQIFHITEIVKRIGRVDEITVDEASELFGVDLSDATNIIETADSLITI